MARRRQETWTTVSVKPLTGVLDTRSDVDDVALGAWRFKMNWFLRGGSKLSTRPGWDRAFSSFKNQTLTPPAYTNADLHDKSIAVGPNPQEFITLQFEASDNQGDHFLYAGTQSTVFMLDSNSGYWSAIATGMGGAPEPSLPQTRFRMSELQNTVLFTNNTDRPRYSAVGSTTSSTVPELVSLGLTQAAITISFGGFLFLMDVVEGGQRITSRIRWSGINCPLSWLPGANDCATPPAVSLANYQDLEYGERILAAVPMAGSLYVFTTRAIWVAFINASGTGSVFAFAKVYSEPLNQSKCLAYPNAIVTTGNSVWYAGSDGIYFFSPYIPEPIREEWLYRGSSLVFNDNLSALDPSCCQSPVMGLHPDTNEIWLSWPETAANPNGGCVNSKTLVFDYMYRSPDIVDYGFSSFVNFRPTSDNPEACQSAQLFLGASCQDLCLKEIGNIFSRARCTNAATGQGTGGDGGYVPFIGQYSYDGYYRILRSLLPLQNFDREKFIRNFLLECIPSADANDNVVHLRIGTSESEADPNLPDGTCTVLWFPMPDIALKCNTALTSSELAAQGLKNIPAFEWSMMQSGRFLYFEITVQAKDGSPAVGADCVMSRIETEIRLATK